MRKKVARLLSIPVLVVLLLAALGPSACGVVTDDVTVKIGTTQQVSTDNVFAYQAAAAAGGDSEHMRLMYEALVWQMGDGSLRPGLAESWDYDEATMTYTIILNSKAKWSDGEKVTADDVKFSIDTLIELGTTYAFELSNWVVETNPIVVIDDETVQFKVAVFNARFVRHLGYFLIAPEHVWGDMTNDEMLAYDTDNHVISGPFALREREVDSHEIYDARKDYWGGTPKIDVVQRVHFNNDESQLLAFKSGAIDTISSFQMATAIPQLLSDENITVFQVSDNKTLSLYPNHRIEPWNLAAFRNAVSIGINRADLISYAANGWAKTPVMLERDPGYPDVIDEAAWAYENNTQEERVDLANDALDAIPLMSDMPADPPDGWTRTYDGTPLDFEFMCASYTDHVAVAEMLAADFAAMGIDIDVASMGFSALMQQTFRQAGPETQDQWDMFIWARAFSPEYDYLCTQWQYYEELNNSKRSSLLGWTDATAQVIGDKMAQLQQLPEGTPTRDDLIEETQLLWSQQLPAIPLFTFITPGVYRTDNVKGWLKNAAIGTNGTTVTAVTLMNLEPI